MKAAATLRFAPGVRLHQEEGGIAFLLVPEGVVELSPSAVAILELVNGLRSRDEIVDLLAERYDAPAEELRVDVIELCEALRGRGFLLE